MVNYTCYPATCEGQNGDSLKMDLSHIQEVVVRSGKWAVYVCWLVSIHTFCMLHYSYVKYHTMPYTNIGYRKRQFVYSEGMIVIGWSTLLSGPAM